MVLAILAEYWYITILAVILVASWYLGAFTTMQPAEVEFHGGTFFYHNLQSSTSNLGNLIFTQVAADVKKYVDTLPTKVPYPLAAIYYDDPGDLVDSDTMRVSVGFIVRVKNDTVA